MKINQYLKWNMKNDRSKKCMFCVYCTMNRRTHPRPPPWRSPWRPRSSCCCSSRAAATSSSPDPLTVARRCCRDFRRAPSRSRTPLAAAGSHRRAELRSSRVWALSAPDAPTRWSLSRLRAAPAGRSRQSPCESNRMRIVNPWKVKVRKIANCNRNSFRNDSLWDRCGRCLRLGRCAFDHFQCCSQSLVLHRNWEHCLAFKLEMEWNGKAKIFLYS